MSSKYKKKQIRLNAISAFNAIPRLLFPSCNIIFLLSLFSFDYDRKLFLLLITSQIDHLPLWSEYE